MEYAVEHCLARLGVRLVWPSIHLSMVVDRNRQALAGLEQGVERPYERVGEWWPKFVHRFKPAEQVWRLEGSAILQADEGGREFGAVLAARDELADQVVDAWSMVSGEEAGPWPAAKWAALARQRARAAQPATMMTAPVFPELFESTTVLEERMDAFYESARERTCRVGKKRLRQRPVWAQENAAWDAHTWNRSGPQSPGYGWVG